MSKKGLIILILICTLVIIVFIGSTSLLSLISSNHKSTQVDKREEEVIPAYVVQESDLPIKEGHDSVIVTKLNNNHILLIDLRYRGYKLINETGEEIKKAYNFKRIALQHVSDDGFIIQYTRLDEVTKTEKIDLSGQVVWSFDGLIANFDGLHMFDYQKESIGHIFFTTNQDFIMKLNQEGDIIWQKGPYSLLNYIGTNSEYYIYVNNDFTRLYQFNESGNIKELSLSNVKRLTSSNEYFYIVTQNAIEQYDYQLNIKYTYTIENWDIKEIYVDENNNLYTLYKPLDSQLYKVIKLDTNGNKVYETILENQNNGLFNFYELKDGYILVSQLELPQENSNEINRKHYYLLKRRVNF